MRVNDAQCLAAANAAKDNGIQLIQTDSCYFVIDINQKAGERVLAKESDLEKAGILYQIAYFRPMLEAALNVC